MKNKNNKSVQELVNLIIDIQKKKGNRDHAYAFALGVVQSILDWEVKGYHGGKLQNTINDQYTSYEAELRSLSRPVFNSAIEDQMLANGLS